MGDCPVTWSVGIHSIELAPQVYDSFLGEFPTSHGDMVDDEHNFSSSDGQSVREDHLDVRGHAVACVLDLKGSWEEHFPFGRVRLQQ